MARSALRICLLLAISCVTDGQSTTADDSHCSYTFKVPTNDCGQTPMEDQLTKSLLVALQTQVKLLARNQEKLTDENTKLRQEVTTLKSAAVQDRDENAKLRQKMATLESGRNRSVVNVKQCSKRGLGEGKEYGLLFSCDFVKKHNDTVLRVVWNGDIRLIDTGSKGSSARRWFFTINGNECSVPRTIDTQLYVRDSDSINIHRVAYVEGYCRGIAAGDVNVAWNVGDVTNGQSSYNIGDSHTGWVATVRIIVEEVAVDSADTVIV